MRIPKKPPTPAAGAGSIERAAALLSVGIGPTICGKYLHWDELIRRSAPDGVSHKVWWDSIKLYRAPLLKDLPLLDKAGQPFRYAEVPLVAEPLHKIDLGAGGLIEMPDQITNPETRDRYYISSLIEEAITSSQLEGATTTRKVAEEMIRSGRAPRDRSERMIYNNFLTMRRIADFKTGPLTVDLVFELHRLVTDQTLDEPNQAGRFRRADEPVHIVSDRDEIVHVPPPADQLPDRLDAMCAFANCETPSYFIHPVIRSIILHFWLAYDHPFVDGNGRTARALFYWSMLRNKYWLFEFVSISRIINNGPAKYGRAFLYSETDDNDITYFLLYHLQVIDRAIKELHEFIRRKTMEVRSLETRIRSVERFNHRQRALISHALRHPHHRYSIESHRKSHDVVYQTARTDLLDLENHGLFRKRKDGRKYYFIPETGLEERLRKLER